MSYDSKIVQTQLEGFAELYEIRIGLLVSRFTSFSKDVLFLGNLYKARPLKRSEFSFAEKLRSVRCRVTAPLDPVFIKYVANVPPKLVNVQIFRVFVDNPDIDYIYLFNGNAISVTIEGNVAHAECESSSTELRNKIPRLFYQARCNHMLFDSGCGLFKEDFAVSAVVTVSGSQLTSAAFGAYANDYFIQGHVEFEDDMRMITNKSGNTITLQLPFDSSLKTGGTVKAYPGCNKTASICVGTFNNLQNRLAFDHIPSSNPTIWRIE